MKTEIIKTSKLNNNTGQVDGLPKNPRFLKDDKFMKLKKSIDQDPEMLELREVLAYDNGGELVVIGGNMRLRACKELGIKEVPCKILPKETPIEKLKAYTIKDNSSFGDWDFELLANEWDAMDLDDWGVFVPMNPPEIDYSILDGDDLTQSLDDMASGVKKAIQIEFEPEHYEEAAALVKFWRERNAYIGGMIIELLKSEKSKL